MGNRILIWKSIYKDGEFDIYSNTDYSKFKSNLVKNFGGNCPNWGNKLWFQGLCSEIDDGYNEIVFRSNESIEEINSSFDLIIYPMANFFSIEFVSAAEQITNTLSQIKIPVYIISCGAQANSYDDLDMLVKDIGEPSKKFISAVYSTGGEFSLRGNFTKEFFNRLGFKSAVVTGCPSLYQLGRNFKVGNDKVEYSQFNPVFNGKYKNYIKPIMHYCNSAYIDQDMFAMCLYDPDYLSNMSFKFKLRFNHWLGIEAAEMLANNKVKMIVDMNDWYSYLKNCGFNYSFGSRIHGSIMAILAGIPATVLAIDTRTQEMAEFYDIPCVKIDSKSRFSPDNVYEKYIEADYEKFNQNYQKKYDDFEKFLRDHKIVNSVNENNKFLDVTKGKMDFDRSIVNTETFKKFYKQMKSEKPFLAIGNMLMNVKEKL